MFFKWDRIRNLQNFQKKRLETLSQSAENNKQYTKTWKLLISFQLQNGKSSIILYFFHYYRYRVCQAFKLSIRICSEMIIFGSVVNTFEASSITEVARAVTKNCSSLEQNHSSKACSNPWYTLYSNLWRVQNLNQILLLWRKMQKKKILRCFYGR